MTIVNKTINNEQTGQNLAFESNYSYSNSASWENNDREERGDI